MTDAPYLPPIADSQEPSRRLNRLVPRRRGWGLLGLVTLLLIIPITLSNLQEIYNSEKDFVVGLAFSAAAFCFGRAYSDQGERAAVDEVRSNPASGPVADALKRHVYYWLARRGAFAETAVLNNQLTAAADSLNRFFDLQSSRADIAASLPTLEFAMSNVERSLASVHTLRSMLDTSIPAQMDRLAYDVRLQLERASRAMQAAGERRRAFEDWMTPLVPAGDVEFLQHFRVLTSDVYQSTRSLQAIVNLNDQRSLVLQLGIAAEFIDVAGRRIKEGVVLLASRGITELPPVHSIMLQDLEYAERVVLELIRSNDRATYIQLTTTPDA